MYQTQANQQQLPVPFDTWDQSTVNNALPQGNDVWPQLNIPQSVGGEAVGQIVCELRAMMQSRLGRTPLHTFAYNLLSQNRFNNQMFTNWCQRTVDFVEFLVVAQYNNPGVAISKAVAKIYYGILAVTAGEYPQVGQMLDQATYNQLLGAGKEFEDIMNDIKAFHMAGRQPQGYSQQGGYGGQPMGGQPMGGQPATPQGYGGGGYNAPQGYGGQPMGGPSRGSQLPPVGAAPRPQQMPQAAPPGYGTQHGTQPSPTATSATPAAGRYMDEPEPATPSGWSSNGGFTQPSQPAQPTAAPVEPAPVQQVDEGDAPKSIEDVVMDPFFFIPRGQDIDHDRPYDHFYNPGGVEIAPAHLSKWTRTKGSETPYPIGHDPQQFVLFHVHWPDGVVHEKVVKWSSDMDYLKHEINDKLRGMKIKPEGKVIASQHKITDYDELDIPAEDLEATVSGPLDVAAELNPVAVTTLFSASSDLENELMARVQLIEDLGLPKDTKTLPAYEYISGCLYPIELDKDVEDKLFSATESRGLVSVARRLHKLMVDGGLPIRYYRFFNERLTKGLNSVLADNLALPNLNVDSFVDDVDELYDVLQHGTKYDPAYVKVLDSQTSAFMKRWFNLAYEQTEGDEAQGQLNLFEEVVNLQTRWTTEEISSLNLTPKEPVLISQSAHAKLYQVLKTMVERHLDNGNLPGTRLRIISVDGHYYEVIRGWLVEGSILLKDLG
jgi:hypothetical protein